MQHCRQLQSRVRQAIADEPAEDILAAIGREIDALWKIEDETEHGLDGRGVMEEAMDRRRYLEHRLTYEKAKTPAGAMVQLSRTFSIIDRLYHTAGEDSRFEAQENARAAYRILYSLAHWLRKEHGVDDDLPLGDWQFPEHCDYAEIIREKCA